MENLKLTGHIEAGGRSNLLLNKFVRMDSKTRTKNEKKRQEAVEILDIEKQFLHRCRGDGK